MHNVIVGTGPAAAAAILALADDPSEQITVVDIGEQLADDKAAAVDRMSALQPAQWANADRELVTVGPAERAGSALPEKRAYGSNHMFVDLGQQRGLVMPDRGNDAAVSGAFGGFSTVWGAQIMPFSRATFDRWPFGWDDIEPHYRAVLAEVPLAAEADDYAEDFPLLSSGTHLPPVSARTAAVLSRYRRHRDAIRAAGIVVGKARLALAGNSCVKCGLCMTGCPYSLIYSARHTIDRFVARGRVRHISRVLITAVDQPIGRTPSVRGIDLASGREMRLEADRVFVGAGGLGTTRIALNSLHAPPRQVGLQESMQFLVPLVSRRSTGDPRGQRDFTLNQFNLLLKYDDQAYTTSQVHCYPYNPAIADALPGWLPPHMSGAVLGRVTAALGYLPSWRSPKMRIELRARHQGALPDIAVRVVSDRRPAMMISVLRRLSALGPKLDLFPVLPMVRLSGPGKSYHFGSTFPHRSNFASGPAGSDVLGRIGGFRNVHLIDGSVLPSVPSTTFTLTVMANAHRIVSASRHV
jgi:choline dehydrogenase-like flavoprotein